MNGLLKIYKDSPGSMYLAFFWEFALHLNFIPKPNGKFVVGLILQKW